MADTLAQIREVRQIATDLTNIANGSAIAAFNHCWGLGVIQVDPTSKVVATGEDGHVLTGLTQEEMGEENADLSPQDFVDGLAALRGIVDSIDPRLALTIYKLRRNRG